MSWLGFDIGGTRIKAGILADDGTELAACAENYDCKAGIGALENALEIIGGKVLSFSNETLRGIGASITGPIDPEKGCVYLPGKIDGLQGHETVPFLANQFGAPCVAGNDGAMACFAEWKAGAGQGLDDLVVLTLGTGIGSGVILEGKLLTGGGFQRGLQIGHFVIDLNGPFCLTGPQGTGESIASITALLTAIRDHLARGIPSRLDPRAVDFPSVVEAIRSGDKLANQVFERWFLGFRTVVLNAYLAYTPQRIVLAGGPVAASDLFMDRLRSDLEKLAFRFPAEKPIDIRPAQHGEKAGWFGAVLYAREQFSS